MPLYPPIRNKELYQPWIANNIAQGSVNLVLTIGNTGTTDSFVALRSGYVTGLTVHLDNGPIVVGSIDFLIRIDHAPTAFKVTIAAGNSSGIAYFNLGDIPVIGGTTHIGMVLTSTNPLTPNNAMHAVIAVEVTENP